MLSEKSQSQRYYLSIYATFSKWKNYRAREQIGGCQGLEDDRRGGVYDRKK